VRALTFSDDPGVRLYLRFAEFFNARDYEGLGSVLAHDFTDHHPGLVDVTGLETYRRNLAAVIEALDMHAEPEQLLGSGGAMLSTRIRLTGRHVGTFLGLEPTGRPLEWYTHEIWHRRGRRFVERWAVDDLLGMLAQTGFPTPVWVDPA
jgi:predicted ester cyclase